MMYYTISTGDFWAPTSNNGEPYKFQTREEAQTWLDNHHKFCRCLLAERHILEHNTDKYWVRKNGSKKFWHVWDARADKCIKQVFDSREDARRAITMVGALRDFEIVPINSILGYRVRLATSNTVYAITDDVTSNRLFYPKDAATSMSYRPFLFPTKEAAEAFVAKLSGYTKYKIIKVLRKGSK